LDIFFAETNNSFRIVVFNVISAQLTANVPPLHAVANFGTDYFLLKIKNFAKRERQLPTKLAIA
jgi:hypothetical protein